MSTDIHQGQGPPIGKPPRKPIGFFRLYAKTAGITTVAATGLAVITRLVFGGGGQAQTVPGTLGSEGSQDKSIHGDQFPGDPTNVPTNGDQIQGNAIVFKAPKTNDNVTRIPFATLNETGDVNFTKQTDGTADISVQFKGFNSNPTGALRGGSYAIDGGTPTSATVQADGKTFITDPTDCTTLEDGKHQIAVEFSEGAPNGSPMDQTFKGSTTFTVDKGYCGPDF